MIFLFRANGIFASRVNKYVDYYKKTNRQYKVIGWDRLGEDLRRESYDFFRYQTRYVQGGIKAIIARLKWMRFVYKYLKKHREFVTTIHACDLDVALPAVLFKKRYKKNVHIIFDVCDWMSASQNKGVIKKIMQRGEKFTVKRCNNMILCEPERIQQIQFEVPIPVHIMRNIPSFADTDFLNEQAIKPFDNNKVTVAYVGWFGHGRFIDELLDYSENGTINLLIAGFGMNLIEEHAKRLDKETDNIRFFGKVDYKFGLQILKAADIIYAMYCKSIPNHFFAAPNKFYESMFLGKPILSTKGIPLQDKIERYNTGYTIEEDINELASFFENITKEELKEKGRQAHSKWPYFATLTDKFMIEEYSKMIL